MSEDTIARGAIESLERVLTERDRRYTERFAAQEGANKLALEAAEKAVLKAENASEKRFEAVNEFRATLSDQAATFITRKEVEALMLAVNATLGRHESSAANISGRGSGMGQLLGWLVAAASAGAALVALFR
jgi:hypothetical protein